MDKDTVIMYTEELTMRIKLLSILLLIAIINPIMIAQAEIIGAHGGGKRPGYSTEATPDDSQTYSVEQIKEVQTLLNSAGYDCGVADGVAGSKTEAAIRKYQNDHGLTETGTISEDLIRYLKNEDEDQVQDDETEHYVISEVVDEDSWKCPQCETIVTGNFCNNCGEKKPSEEWECPNCGQIVTGNFCSNCGAAKTSDAIDESEAETKDNYNAILQGAVDAYWKQYPALIDPNSYRIVWVKNYKNNEIVIASMAKNQEGLYYDIYVDSYNMETEAITRIGKERELPEEYKNLEEIDWNDVVEYSKNNSRVDEVPNCLVSREEAEELLRSNPKYEEETNKTETTEESSNSNNSSSGSSITADERDSSDDNYSSVVQAYWKLVNYLDDPASLNIREVKKFGNDIIFKYSASNQTGGIEIYYIMYSIPRMVLHGNNDNYLNTSYSEAEMNFTLASTKIDWGAVVKYSKSEKCRFDAIPD